MRYGLRAPAVGEAFGICLRIMGRKSLHSDPFANDGNQRLSPSFVGIRVIFHETSRGLKESSQKACQGAMKAENGRNQFWFPIL